jgi:hypothetical protein
MMEGFQILLQRTDVPMVDKVMATGLWLHNNTCV